MPRKENTENIAKRKEQIIKAAITAFSRAGFKGTSMNDIVRESGLSKGAIYWYFKSKNELISELLDTFFDPGEIELLDKLLSDGTATERLCRLKEYLVDAMNKMRRYRPVIQELYVIAFRDAKIRKTAKKTFQASTTLVEQVINYGIEQKEFKKVDPHQIAATLFEIVEGTALFWFLGLVEADFENQLRGGIDLLLQAIKVNE